MSQAIASEAGTQQGDAQALATQPLATQSLATQSLATQSLATQSLATLTWLVAITVLLDASLAILYGLFAHRLGPAFLCMLAIYGWRGTWFGMWTLWAVAASPWRKAGGMLAAYLGLMLATTAAAITAGGLPANDDGKLTVVYGAAVAAWLLIARLFGLRIAHVSQAAVPHRWQWSIRSLVVVITLASLTCWIAGMVWRLEASEVGLKPIVYSGFNKLFILMSMIISLVHAFALVVVLTTKWGRYSAWIVGAVLLIIVLRLDFPRPAAWALGQIGMTLVACAIFREKMEQDGWQTFFELPFWEQVGVPPDAISASPSKRMSV